MKSPVAAIAFVVVSLLVLAVVGKVRAHEPYIGWMRPGTMLSCCNGDDRRPTRAYKDDDGRWRAWDGIRWLIVPPDALLPQDLAGDGRSHLCASPAGTVHCFSPAQPKS